MDPKYNFLMTGLGFRGMPNWASHTHPGGQNEEETGAKQLTMSYLIATPFKSIRAYQVVLVVKNPHANSG